jgi:2-keto-3-deoxy-L-rhamnonate aldolase RhmA
VRTPLKLTLVAGAVVSVFGFAQAPRRLNPVIELLSQKKPVFGIYAPANRGGGRRGGAPPADAPPPKTQAQLAQEVLAYKGADYIFDGSMEGDFDRAYATFGEFVKGLSDGGMIETAGGARLRYPLIVKTHEIAENPALAAERIAKQLNLGLSGVVFVGVESADEVKTGLAAMRFKSNGGTRPDDVGNAPAVWGMSAKEYKEKADVWPLNPKGELINFTIVESLEGLKHVREIAAVGAGTLGGVFSKTDSTGRRVRDEAAWEAAIQQVLAACKEFNVPCGYPANTSEQIEQRMKQGFSVFISGWGDAGFKAIETGKKLGGR